MTIEEFPPHEDADEEGLLAIGGDLEVSSLLLAYSNGIFPWPLGRKNILAWFSPPMRTLLKLESFKIHKSVKKLITSKEISISHDKAFAQVINACATVKRSKASGTWISNDIINAYIKFFDAGYGFSTEVWKDGALVGGVYGVKIGKYFAGESMFHVADNCSKIALIALLNRISDEQGSFLDCQVMNPFLESLGAFEIPRDEFLALLPPLLGTTIVHKT